MELEPESRAEDYGYKALAQPMALSGTWEDDRPGLQSLPAHCSATLGQLHNHSEPHFPYLSDADDRGADLIRQMRDIRVFAMSYFPRVAQTNDH